MAAIRRQSTFDRWGDFLLKLSRLGTIYFRDALQQLICAPLVGAPAQNSSTVAHAMFRRQTPRWEPSAIPLVRFCVKGAQ